MALRADAPVFIPSAAAKDVGMDLAQGDRLIQELAAALMSPGPDARRKQPVPERTAAVFCPEPDALCCLLPRRNKTAHFLTSKIVSGAVPGLTSRCVLPASGIFCPYCIAGSACAFHKPPVPGKLTRTLPDEEGYCKLADDSYNLVCAPGVELRRHRATEIHQMAKPTSVLDSTSLFHAEIIAGSCVAHEGQLMLDDGSEGLDYEEGSTDIGGSDVWCAGSDASDSHPTSPGYEILGSAPQTTTASISMPLNHNKIHHMGNEVLAGAGRWGRHKRCDSNSGTLAAW